MWVLNILLKTSEYLFKKIIIDSFTKQIIVCIKPFAIYYYYISIIPPSYEQ